MEGRKGLARSEPESREFAVCSHPYSLPLLLTPFPANRKAGVPNYRRENSLHLQFLRGACSLARSLPNLNRDLNHQVTSILNGLAKYDELNEISLARVVREGH